MTPQWSAAEESNLALPAYQTGPLPLGLLRKWLHTGDSNPNIHSVNSAGPVAKTGTCATKWRPHGVTIPALLAENQVVCL